MNVTEETPVQELVEAYPQTIAVFEQYGVHPEEDCPEEVRDFPIEDCEWMCAVDDIDGLIEDLNKVLQKVEE